MKTFVIVMLLLVIVAIVFRKGLVQVRHGRSIKWIASSYVVLLLVIALIVSTKDGTVHDATSARLAEAQAHNEQLENATSNLKPVKTWTQTIDEETPFILQADVLSYYRVVENDQLHNQVKVQLFFNDVITDNIDYKDVMPQLKVEQLDQGLSLVQPKDSPLIVHVATDRLPFVQGQYRRFGEVSQYDPGAAYIVIEVPTGVVVQAPQNFSQW